MFPDRTRQIPSCSVPFRAFAFSSHSTPKPSPSQPTGDVGRDGIRSFFRQQRSGFRCGAGLDQPVQLAGQRRVVLDPERPLIAILLDYTAAEADLDAPVLQRG